MLIQKAIAGIQVLIQSLPDYEIRQTLPVSEIFITAQDASAEDPRIQIRLSDKPMPTMDPQALLFRADPLWSIYRDDRFNWIVLHPPALPKPMWTARLNHDFTEAVVYCSEHLMESIDGRAVVYDPVSYPLDQILLMHFLAHTGGMLIHACGWLYHGSTWIFAGKSGAGKSTISNLIMKTPGSRFLSDDRIIIRKAGDEFLSYGTPWPGEAGYALNESAPLKGIFFLHKGRQNKIEKLNSSDSFARLMPVVSIPWYDREAADLLIGFCAELMDRVALYDLTFAPDEAIVDMLAGFVDSTQPCSGIKQN